MLIVLEGRGLSDDLLQSTMCIVEQTLNYQPLSPVSSEPQDFEALRPNHFLLGRLSNSLPYIRDAEKFVDSRQMFKNAQAYADCIWRQWLKEYIPQLNIRSKWTESETQNLKKDDLVWIIDDQAKRCDYKMGRVLEVYPGSDGIVGQL